MSQPQHFTLPTQPNPLPPPYSHHINPSALQQHSNNHQQLKQLQLHLHHQPILRPPDLKSPPPSSPIPSSPSNKPRLSSINTLNAAHAPLSPLQPSPGACPPYLFELAQSDQRIRSGFLSREPSLPSIMSLPPTRPISPDHSHSPKTSFVPQQSPTSPITSSNPTSPHLSRRFITRSSARALSNLCMFEDGLQHYERLRTPSLRGHSRRGSLILSSKQPHDQLSNEMFELDLSDDYGDQTFRPARWSDDDDDDDDNDDDYEDIESEPQGSGAPTRKLFKVGDRVGVGTIHQGHKVRDLFQASGGSSPRICQNPNEHDAGSGILEIVRQIGVGSYAVVYLVREVLYDPDLDFESTPLDSTLSQTPRASDGFASLSAFGKVASTRKRASSQVVYGKDFALKCLCKRNLSDELLVLQRGEAELHRSLPLHHNIVTLHRALETPNWLFLVIEYCPGQDLFYWLEQARDSQDLESISSRTNSCTPNLPVSIETTLSPVKEYSCYSRSADLCNASFNTPPSPSLLASTADDEMLSRRRLRLISKMFVQMCDAVEACHQVGVCHRDIKPENFIVVDDRKGRSSDSWKTQSNESQIGPRSSVIVKITDWGLGTSSKFCEDFDCGSKPYMAYECRNNLHPTYDPVQADIWSLGIVLLNLLYHRCPWADPTCSDPDFCEFRRGPVDFLRGRFEGMAESVASFLAEKIFCEVGAGRNQHRISAGQFGEWARNLLQHMGGGQLHASVSDATIALSPSSARGLVDQRRSVRGSSQGGLSQAPSQRVNAINLPNPVLPPPLQLPDKIKEDICKPASLLHMTILPADEPKSSLLPMKFPEMIKEDMHKSADSPLNSWPIKTLEVKELSEPTEILADEVLRVDAPIGAAGATEDIESPTAASKIESDKSKRRKRGARKGRKGDGKPSGTDPEPPSPASERAEVDVLDGLAEASQSLAREISQATRTKKTSEDVTTTKRKMNIAERMMEKFRDGSNPDLQAFVARARAREAAYMGKAKSNTASAPAQLQEINRTGQNNVFARSMAMSTSSSSGIGTTMSTSSSISWGTSSDCSSFSKPSSMTHWSSASNRRERIQKTNNLLSPPVAAGSSSLSTTLGSRKDASSSTTTLNNNSNQHNPTKKEESKNKLAQLLTTFKRYNSTVGNHLSSSASVASSIPAASASITPFKVDNP